MSIKNRLSAFKELLPAHCELIAVSKTHPVEAVREAYDAGQRKFGENKVQELVPKAEALPRDIEWHMIGHLQSNKVKYIAPFIHLIHSVDSFKLLEEIDKQAKKANRIIACLLQVHIAREETKFGFSEQEILELIKSGSFTTLANVQIQGLMGMATLTDNKEQIRSEFQNLRSLSDKLKRMTLPANVAMKELSMGMSSDYREAIEQGSTFIRVGTAIFGNRDYNKS
ncbi:MAG TPA: YggS family pyridoxal phosphate-dependent enzyme [Chryseosolibacter sp.]